MFWWYWQAMDSEPAGQIAGNDTGQAADSGELPAPDETEGEQQDPGQEAAEDAGAATEETEVIGDAAESYEQGAQMIRELTGVETQGITLTGLGLAVIAIVLAVFVRMIVTRIINRYLKRLVQKTETEYDDRILAALHRSVGYFIILGGVFLAFSFIELPREPLDFQSIVWRILNTLIVISAGLLIYRITEITLNFMASKRGDDQKSLLDEQFLPLIRDVAKIALIVIVIVMIVQSWGYSAAGILAGVGIGGLALAFAAQDTVANIFGSFVVYADRPYKVGDWILLGGVEGTVEQIGIRSTRIRTFDKTLVSVPNKVVTNENIQNFSEMPIRRIKLYVGVSYDSTTEQVREVVNGIRELLANHPSIDQRFWMVNLTELSDWSLDILVYCFTTTTVWQEYMDIRQDVLLRIIELCHAHGVEIAFPSRTIYHRQPGVAPESSLPPEFRKSRDDLIRELRKGSPGESAEPPTQPGVQPMEHDTAEGE